MRSGKSPHGSETRKRKSNPDTWKQQSRKRLRQAGKEYVNSKGTLVPERSVKGDKKDCVSGCKFKCSQKISPEERKMLFDNLWHMSQVEKQHYFAKTTERFEIKRCRTIKGKDSRRKFSYYYNFFVDEVKHSRLQRILFVNIGYKQPTDNLLPRKQAWNK